MDVVFPSQRVCAQLDIEAEKLDAALTEYAETTGTSTPRGRSFTEMLESAVALEHQSGEGAEDDWHLANQLQDRLDEMRLICARANEHMVKVRRTRHRISLNLFGNLDAAEDALRDAISRAMRAANNFERDWTKRKTLARLQSK